MEPFDSDEPPFEPFPAGPEPSLLPVEEEGEEASLVGRLEAQLGAIGADFSAGDRARLRARARLILSQLESSEQAHLVALTFSSSDRGAQVMEPVYFQGMVRTIEIEERQIRGLLRVLAAQGEASMLLRAMGGPPIDGPRTRATLRVLGAVPTVWEGAAVSAELSSDATVTALGALVRYVDQGDPDPATRAQRELGASRLLVRGLAVAEVMRTLEGSTHNPGAFLAALGAIEDDARFATEAKAALEYLEFFLPNAERARRSLGYIPDPAAFTSYLPDNAPADEDGALGALRLGSLPGESQAALRQVLNRLPRASAACLIRTAGVLGTTERELLLTPPPLAERSAWAARLLDVAGMVAFLDTDVSARAAAVLLQFPEDALTDLQQMRPPTREYLVRVLGAPLAPAERRALLDRLAARRLHELADLLPQEPSLLPPSSSWSRGALRLLLLAPDPQRDPAETWSGFRSVFTARENRTHQSGTSRSPSASL
jgi:hypothetical protein